MMVRIGRVKQEASSSKHEHRIYSEKCQKNIELVCIYLLKCENICASIRLLAGVKAASINIF
jgi:hypothetical protein